MLPWHMGFTENTTIQESAVSEKDSSVESKGDYWQSYYSGQVPLVAPLPSQFAVFIAGEMNGPHEVFDIGCGGGRDSLFFGAHSHAVTGIDGSQAAIDKCRELARMAGVAGARFVCSPVTSDELANTAAPSAGLPVLVYARFFLHAITDEEEQKFFRLARVLTSAGGKLAVEFRTMRDLAQEKVTASHYRRFIDPIFFNARALEAGFSARYFVEGFGFAKYKHDDAHVARFIFERVVETNE
jgi:cyclopropane fatty-acyl-phospholipid synthase-like methyltransferase